MFSLQNIDSLEALLVRHHPLCNYTRGESGGALLGPTCGITVTTPTGLHVLAAVEGSMPLNASCWSQVLISSFSETSGWSPQEQLD